MTNKKEKSENPLRNRLLNNFKTVISVVRYRIVFIILAILAVFFLMYVFGIVFRSTTNVINQVFVYLCVIVFSILPMAYAYRCGNQILFELSVNASIYRLRKEINDLKLKKEKDFRPLQVKLNNLRINLKNFIEFSEILNPPVYNYELNRLHKRIDIFFNSIGEALFPTPHVFSRAQKIESQQLLDYYESQEHPTREEIDEQYEEMQKAETGVIDWFGIYALDEFLQYLEDALFTPTKPYSPFSYKHPINMIFLSRFFEYWNSIVASCRNCKRIYEKASKDIEEYYRLLGERKTQQRQRMRRITDDAFIVIISVLASTIVGYLIK